MVSDIKTKMIDVSAASYEDFSPDKIKAAENWAPLLIKKAEIDERIEYLANLPQPINGRRQVQFVHPSAPAIGQGFTPGVKVTLDVLLPGEQTQVIRHNSTQVNFCIQGSGYTLVNEKKIQFQQYDVWNHPSYAIYSHVNDSKDIQVRLTYSNAALLEMMRVHVVDENPPTLSEIRRQSEEEVREELDGKKDASTKSPFGTFDIGDDGAQLMPYEILISPPAVESKAMHWPWQEVKENLDKLTALGKEYVGRRLYLLHNPMTGRFNGTTPNFFATMTIRPPNIIDRPHRHVSSAINYYFSGSGFSVVDKKKYEWSAGDLMVSAPGWAVHNHGSYDDGPVRELTIQDQPLNIFMESLLWQETLESAPKVLGTDSGFSTNR